MNIHNVPNIEPLASQPSVEKQKRSKVVLFLVSLGCLVFLGIFLGNVHLVGSSSGLRLVRKISFSFAETYVSLDKINGAPAYVAKATYPRATMALERDHLIGLEPDGTYINIGGLYTDQCSEYSKRVAVDESRLSQIEDLDQMHKSGPSKSKVSANSRNTIVKDLRAWDYLLKGCNAKG